MKPPAFDWDEPKRLFMTIGLGVAIVVMVLGAAAVARRVAPFVCPSCGESFFEGLFVELGFIKTCAHCGVAIGTPMSASPDGVANEDGDGPTARREAREHDSPVKPYGPASKG